jgi:hypothetical protein
MLGFGHLTATRHAGNATPSFPDARSILGWGLALALALFAICSFPYIFGAITTPSDRVYTGLMFNVPDHSQYWSWVTESRHGLFISNTMTPEPNPPLFMNGMMWVLAQLQTAFNLSFPTLFQLWRVAGTLLLVPAVLFVCATLCTDRAEYRIAAVIALLGSGFGWMLVLAKKALRLPDVPWPLDVHIVETNTFWTLLGYPYYALAEGVLLSTLMAVFLADRSKSKAAAAAAAVGALALGFLHAYDLILVYAICGVFALVRWATTRRFPWFLAYTLAAVAMASAPLSIYYVYLTSADPLWKSILAQYPNAGVWTPTPPHMVILLGFPLLLAAAQLFDSKPRDERDWFVLTWLAVGFALIYLPTVYQVKMLVGLQMPIAVLAARTWQRRVEPTLARALVHRASLSPWVVPVSAFLVAALCAPTNVYLYAWRVLDLSRHEAPFYLHRDEAAALDWLAHHASKSDVVLSTLDVGRFVPSYGASRAFLAHWAMTNRYFERMSLTDQFFSPGTSQEWREGLLHREGITLIVRPAPLGVPALFDPGRSAGFERVFSAPNAQVYRYTAGGD